MAYRSLPKFNPEARFIANRPFLYNGHTLQPGDAVEGIPKRRLRQLPFRQDYTPHRQRLTDPPENARLHLTAPPDRTKI